jgi:hypothetical protein
MPYSTLRNTTHTNLAAAHTHVHRTVVSHAGAGWHGTHGSSSGRHHALHTVS